MPSPPIKPWVESVILHPDVLSDNFSEDIFALDLGPLADGNPNVPAVYRDPERFFRASYLTHGLRSLLQDVLSHLSGGDDIVKLLGETPNLILPDEVLEYLISAGGIKIHDTTLRDETLDFLKRLTWPLATRRTACSEHDFVGSNARARRIDERRAKEFPAESLKRPATRIATAILMYSFGGLRRKGASETELLPPGITEADLMSVCVGPDLDSTTVQACLKQLKDQCLYLHFDGVRYCFKKDPNITLLVEQEAEAVGRDEDLVPTRIKEMLEARLAGHNVVIWPAKSGEMPDKEPTFLVAYMPLEFGAETKPERQKIAKDIFENHGDKPRQFRNGVALAVPTADTVIRKAIVRGVKECAFGYASGGTPLLGADGKFQVAPAKVRFETTVADDEIDLESGFLMLPQTIPQPAPALTPSATPGQPPGGTPPGTAPTPTTTPQPGTLPSGTSGLQTEVELKFTANRTQLYTAWNVVANLADIAGQVTVTVKAQKSAGLDKSRLQNGVIEPLTEAGSD